uniref:Juvenile hormone esterase binding protein n=1 Tax=Amblyomma aureolatum TaxID=187763 RepID=A0A1E1X4A3_9ACAR
MYQRSLQLPMQLHVMRCAVQRNAAVTASPCLLSAAHIHTSCSRRDAHPRMKGRSFILQNPFRWLSLFFDFMHLKNEWDPEFNRSQFLEGAKQAISTVLSLIATQKLDDLAGLVKREAVNKFMQEVFQELGYGNAQYLEDPDEVVALPQKVMLQTIVDHKYCDILVNFIVLKNLDRGQPSSERPRILMCFILAKFHRNYTAGVLPDWTITDLSLLRTSSVA